MVNNKKKVVIVGLDGATWKLLLPWINQGELPFFKKLMKSGVYGNLKSTIPPMTAPAWVSFQTGVNPGKHGVFDFVEYDKNGEEHIVNSDSIKIPKIWEILEKYGKKSCIINMPVTYPPSKTKKSIIISSFLTPPGKPYTSPPEIQRELEKINYQIDVLFEKYGLFISGEDLLKNRSKIYKQAFKISDIRKKAVLSLSKEKWDLLFVLFRGTDTIQHLYWNSKKTNVDFWHYFYSN
ncbi:alkaline phosphatase family protein, partial [Patescibacteria group bacterium]